MWYLVIQNKTVWSVIKQTQIMDTRGNVQNEKPKIAGDLLNIFLLTYLNVLQCIPRGLSDAISLILQKKNISYADQAEFSLVSYSLCFAFLWAPIVDGVFFKKIGRRKTWTISMQYLIGILLLFVSLNLDDWLGNENGTQKPKTHLLGLTFFLCIFLASNQNIAVNGWALTMLQRRNVGHAAICHNIGYAIGQFLGFVLFILLESKEFCNKFRFEPKNYGFITFSGFIFFWSVVYIVSTTLILLFKKEKNLDICEGESEYRLGFKESYERLRQVGLGPLNGVARLKLIDAGVSSDIFALLTAPSLPLLLVLPFALSRFLIGHLAMRTFLVTYILKLIIAILYAAFIFLTPFLKDEKNALPAWHYWPLLLIYNANALTEHFMFIAVYAFFSRISDPQYGGIYVTLFCAVASIGYRWPTSVCLWLVEPFTIKFKTNRTNDHSVLLDGFFIETSLGTLIGILWLYWAKRKIYKLEKIDSSEWIVQTTVTPSRKINLIL